MLNLLVLFAAFTGCGEAVTDEEFRTLEKKGDGIDDEVDNVLNSKVPVDPEDTSDDSQDSLGSQGANSDSKTPKAEDIDSIEAGFAYLKQHHVPNRGFKQHVQNYSLISVKLSQFDASLFKGNETLIDNLTQTDSADIEVRRWIKQPLTSDCRYFIEIQDDSKVLRSAYYIRCGDYANPYFLSGCVDLEAKFLGLRDIGSFKNSFGVSVTCGLELNPSVDGPLHKKVDQYEFWYHKDSHHVQGIVQEGRMVKGWAEVYKDANNPDGIWGTSLKTQTYQNTDDYTDLESTTIYVPELSKTKLKFAPSGAEVKPFPNGETGSVRCSVSKNDPNLLYIATVYSESKKTLFNLGALSATPSALTSVTLVTDTVDGSQSMYANLNTSGAVTAPASVSYSKITNSGGYFEITTVNESIAINTVFGDFGYGGLSTRHGNVAITSSKIICFGGIRDYSGAANGLPLELRIFGT